MIVIGLSVALFIGIVYTYVGGPNNVGIVSAVNPARGRVAISYEGHIYLQMRMDHYM